MFMDTTRRQDVDGNLAGSTSRLKLSIRSECSGQPFPCFDKHTLPFELQELILAYLPALKLAELKSVCRSWRFLLQSQTFKEKWQLIRGGCSSDILDVWVMKSTNEEEDLMAYIPSLKKYGPFLQLICLPLVITNPCTGLELRKRKCLDGSGPLVLFGDEDWQTNCMFLVYNLKTCQSQPMRRIPIQFLNAGEEFFFRILRPPVLIASVDDDFQFFLVIQTRRSSPAYELCVYKSTTAHWTSYSRESAIDVGFGHLSSVVFFNYNDEESTLYAWSKDNNWYKVHVTFPSIEARLTGDAPSGCTPSTRTNASAFKVFKCEGHVLLITSLVQVVQAIVLQGFVVWKLIWKESSWKWSEIARTPQELCLKSYNEESLFPPTFMMDGRCICAIVSSHEFFPPLVYDVEHDSWCHLHGVVKNMQALFTMKVFFNSDNL